MTEMSEHTHPPIAVIYHADCIDGFGAAYAAWRKFGDAARYLPMHHGDPWQPEDFAGHIVYILDFSFPPPQLTSLSRSALTVTQLDHHASARAAWLDQLSEDPNGHEFRVDREPSLHLVFHMQKSGARLAWEHFHPGQVLPPALAMIEDQDLWRFHHPDTRAFCRALRLLPFAFDEWDTIVRASISNDSDYQAHIANGHAIETFFKREVQRMTSSHLLTPARLRGEPVDALQAQRHGQEIVVDDDRAWLALRGLAINANALFASELGHHLATASESFGLIWQLSGDGQVKASLRANGNIDVAAIAARYGGGGHRNAAGFRLPCQQFFSEVLGIN